MRTFLITLACIVVILLAAWIYLNYSQGQEAIRQQELLIEQQDKANCGRRESTGWNTVAPNVSRPVF